MTLPGKARAGASLFGALLALAVFAVFLVGAYGWLGDRQRDAEERLAGAQAALLADAAATWANSEFTGLLAQVQGGSHEVSVATLRTEGVLPSNFPDIGALGRGWRILLLPAGAGAFDLLVTEIVPAGDRRWPAAALLDSGGRTRLGIVQIEDTRLRGPLIDEDISAWRAAFAGAPAAGALAVLERHDHQSVFGDYLYRTPIPGLPEANRMETHLDLGGNDLRDAGAVTGATLAVAETMEVGGTLTVLQDLTVGQALEVEGDLTVSGTAAMNGMDIEGRLSVEDIAVTDLLEADRAVITGAVEADSASIDSELAAQSVAAATEITAAEVNAPVVRATTSATAGTITATGRLTAASADVSGDATVTGALGAGSVYATGNLSASTAGFGSLTVGSCAGC